MPAFTVIEGDVVVRDKDGNVVGVILDGAVYRLQTEAKVTNFPATQAVSAAALPLPAGASTSANQATEIAGLSSIDATLALVKAKTDNLDVALSTRAVTGLTDAQLRAAAVPVSAASLPLPAGAATEATLATRATEATLATRATEATLATRATEATAALIKAKTDNLDVALSTCATEATLATRLSKADFEARINTLGQKTMAASTPIVFASDQSALPVTFTAANARTGVSHAYETLGGGTANTSVVMRATVYVEPASAAQRSIKSASANDTSAGTGARTVQITYYDNTGAGPLTETVTLNGTTAVNTVATNIRFIESIVVKTAGSLTTNDGVISLYTATAGGGTVIGTIGTGNILAAIGDGQTLWCHHYVAADRTAELAVLCASVQSGGSGTAGRFIVRAGRPLVAGATEEIVGGVLLLGGEFTRAFDFHPKIVGFALLTAYVIPSVNNATVAASFDWSEVPT